MANIVTIKRSSVAGKLPNVSDLQVGELALNLADGIIYSKNTVGNVIIVGSSTTSNIREGSNLYFTNARSQAAVANTNIIFANLTTTGNLTGGSGVGGNITGVNNGQTGAKGYSLIFNYFRKDGANRALYSYPNFNNTNFKHIINYILSL